VEALREWLLEADASGLWGALGSGATQLPDMAHRLAILRETVRDLRAAAEEGEPGQGAKRPKRSTERGEARTKIISALTRHHRYAEGGCMNTAPIGVRELAEDLEVSPDSVSAFFKKEFGDHASYKRACRDTSKLALWLKMLNGDYSPHPLFARTPPGE